MKSFLKFLIVLLLLASPLVKAQDDGLSPDLDESTWESSDPGLDQMDALEPAESMESMEPMEPMTSEPSESLEPLDESAWNGGAEGEGGLPSGPRDPMEIEDGQTVDLTESSPPADKMGSNLPPMEAAPLESGEAMEGGESVAGMEGESPDEF